MDVNKNYYDEYMALSDQALVVILCYESYLLDQMTSKQLAEHMKTLLELLPPEEPEKGSGGLFNLLDP